MLRIESKFESEIRWYEMKFDLHVSHFGNQSTQPIVIPHQMLNENQSGRFEDALSAYVSKYVSG